jgi:hypothetical protein
LIAHRDFWSALGKLKAQGVDIYALSNAIWAELETQDNPLEHAKPEEKRPGRWQLDVIGRTLTFEPIEDGTKIKLLFIE